MTEVVAALIRDGERFLICQRPAHKARGLLWEFVGGKVEPGETGPQALIRECKEELDIVIDVGPVYLDVVHAYPDLTVHLTLYSASIVSGVPRLLEHQDLDEGTAAKQLDIRVVGVVEDESVHKLTSFHWLSHTLPPFLLMSSAMSESR